jgi:hypothetical protein
LVGIVGLTLLLVSARANPSAPVGAEVGTPTAGLDAGDRPAPDVDASHLYDDFIAKLAANLNVADATVVDAAVRTSLKQMVDEHQAAGGLSAEQAAAIKERIDADNFPLSLHPGPGRHHGRRGDDHGRWSDGHDRWDDDRDHKDGWGDGYDRDDDDDWEDRRHRAGDDDNDDDGADHEDAWRDSAATPATSSAR